MKLTIELTTFEAHAVLRTLASGTEADYMLPEDKAPVKWFAERLIRLLPQPE